jgi:hypothetical protein
MKVPVPATLALVVNDPRLGDEHAAFARNPAPLGSGGPVPHWLGEMKVERGGQRKRSLTSPLQA